jgi:hypothetical protein
MFFGISCCLKMQRKCLDTCLAMMCGVYSLWDTVSESVEYIEFSFVRMTEACVLKHAHTYNDCVMLLNALHDVS